MPHELTHRDGKYEFAYAGQAPWHKLGQKLPAAATSAEIIKAAGLDWMVVGEAIYLDDGSLVSGFVANVRSDTRDVLGVVSTDYRPLQNGDALRFVDSLVGEAAAMYYTAGSVRRGRQVFATAKLPESIDVVPGDVVDEYLLVVNNHDGTGGLHLRFTPIRVVCANTLSAALRKAPKHETSIRHVGDLEANLKAAQEALGIGRRYFEAAGKFYRALSARQINTAMLETFINGFLPLPVIDVDSPGSARLERERLLVAHQRIRVLFENGAGNNVARVRGTAWAALNAATEWIDHVRTARQDGALRTGAAEAAVLGVGETLRQRAFKAATDLMN